MKAIMSTKVEKNEVHVNIGLDNSLEFKFHADLFGTSKKQASIEQLKNAQSKLLAEESTGNEELFTWIFENCNGVVYMKLSTTSVTFKSTNYTSGCSLSFVIGESINKHDVLQMVSELIKIYE